LVEAEALGRVGEPDWEVTEPAVGAAGELVSRFRDPRYVAARAARKLAQSDTYAEYPRQLHNILNALKDGEIEVVVSNRGLNDLISKVDILANRLVFALLIAALILGSSLLGIFGGTGIGFDDPIEEVTGMSILGLVGFVIAALLGLLLLLGIVRSGRL